jgi:Domain of unknown function (DUF1844)
MDEDEEKPKAFKVQDRRRFSAEGDLKPEVAREAEASAAASAPTGQVAGSMPPLGGSPNFTAVNEPTREAAPLGELTFATFVVGLSTQALVHLGEMPEPHSGQSARDLPAAEQLIDIIAMLQEKTRGNLDGDEAQLLESILFELRMKYVERARQSSR